MKLLISALLILCSFAFVSAQNPNSSNEGQKISAEVVKLFQAKKFDEALTLAEKAISVIENESGKNHISLASAWRNLAYINAQLGKKKESEKAFEKALSIYEDNRSLSPQDEKLYAEMLENVGIYDAIGGNFIAAEKKYLKAIELREKIGGKDSSDLPSALSKLADIYRLQNLYEKSQPLLVRAFAISTKNKSKLDADSRAIFEELSCLNTKLNQESENEKLRERFNPYQDNKDADGKLKIISGGIVNGKATSLPSPGYPAEARAKKASGAVSVKVLIDEEGNVNSACAVSGARELHRASEWAALQAKFSPTTLSGKTVKVSGIITYNFVL